MKKHFYASGIIAIILSMLSSLSASAQYYEIANRIPSLIQPALSGSGQYKGFIEAGYSKTLGNYDADFLELSTSQGFQYNSWFYMGVGLGVDVLFSHKNDDWGIRLGEPILRFRPRIDHNSCNDTSLYRLPLQHRW